MNIFKMGTLKGLETQQTRVSFLNHRYWAFHLGSRSFANAGTQHSALGSSWGRSHHHPPPLLLHRLGNLPTGIFCRTFLYDDEWHMGTSLSDTHYLKYILIPILPDSFGDYRKYHRNE